MNAYYAAVIIIGNEILSGRTQDANVQFLARELNQCGIRLQEVRVIPDDELAIIGTVNHLRARYHYVFTTGGIGPTHDDITSLAIAKAFGVALIQHPDAVRRLKEYYAEGQLNEARLKMAYVPEGAVLIDNPVSVAPGFSLGNVYVLAGVPSIMQAMFMGFKDELQGGEIVYSKSLSVHLAEGVIAVGFADLQNRYPMVEMGSYPLIHNGRLGTSLVLRSSNTEKLDEAYEMLVQFITSLQGEILQEGEG